MCYEKPITFKHCGNLGQGLVPCLLSPILCFLSFALEYDIALQACGLRDKEGLLRLTAENLGETEAGDPRIKLASLSFIYLLVIILRFCVAFDLLANADFLKLLVLAFYALMVFY